MSDGSRKALTKSTFHFAAGLGSGLFSAVLLQPFDLLKTRVQQSGHHSLTAALADLRRAPHLVPALWRGAVPSALRTGFGSAIYFTSLNAIRQSAARVPFLAESAATAAQNYNGANGRASTSSSLVKLSNTGNLLAGAVARALAGFVLMPLTVIKVRYESSLYSYGSLAGAAGDIWRHGGGVRGFFAGFGATAARDAPYAGAYVLFYEQCKRRLSGLYGGSDAAAAAATAPPGTETRMGVSRAALINFTSGVVAGAAATAATNPFDAVKTRIQLQPGRYRHTLAAARRMLAEEGLRSFWDGLGLRMARKALSSALAWTVYEELVRRAEVRWMSGGRKGEIL